jgi:hypothetical protein
MNPPPPAEAALRSRPRRPGAAGPRRVFEVARGLGGRARLALLAAAGLVVVLLGPIALGDTRRALETAATRGAASGTSYLQAASCGDWRGWAAGERMATIRTLEVAATAPDPETPGATLGRATAYGLFQRACATRASSAALLYEIYNRAASFTGTGGSPTLGGFGNGPHG